MGGVAVADLRYHYTARLTYAVVRALFAVVARGQLVPTFALLAIYNHLVLKQLPFFLRAIHDADIR
jgi:hypothetical protein